MNGALRQHVLALLSLLAVATTADCRDDPEDTRGRSTPGDAIRTVSHDPLSNAVELDWVLVYQMSYDNNLAWAGLPILEMIRAGLVSDRVAVAIFADLPDDDGLFRIVVRSDGLDSDRLSTDDSASSDVFRRNMAWVAQTLPARRYAVIFLDHGGQLDEIGLDERPDRSRGRRWLRLSEVAEIVREWRGATSGEVELLFLQQCGKGNIETYLELAGTARYLMASEIDIDAPNGYYTEVLRALSIEPDVDGLALARLIVEHEPDPMFGAYSVVDASALDELTTRLNSVLEPLVQRSNSSPSPEQDVLFHPAADEDYVDLLVWLESGYRARDLDTSPIREFSEWLTTRLLVERIVSEHASDTLGDTSGLSVLVPLRLDVLERNEGAFFVESTLLDEVHRGRLQ